MIYNEDFETLPREVLETLQLKRLKQVVQRVYAYRGLLPEGLRPGRRPAGRYQLPR